MVSIAPTKTLAKVANHIAKKQPGRGGVCLLLTPDDQTAALAALELADLWGIAQRMAARLAKLGIDTPLTLRDADPSLLRDRLGVVMERMALELRGIPCQSLVETTPANKSIVASRSFGRPVTDRHELEEAVSSHVERAAEKLRRQKLCASVLTVFVRTNPFKPTEMHYSASHAVRMPVATADTARLLAASKQSVRLLWRNGYRYAKAGVELHDMVAAEQVQADLWTTDDDGQSKLLMGAIDKLNASCGRGTVRFASTGVYRAWRLRCESRSPRYSTDWDELLVVIEGESMDLFEPQLPQERLHQNFVRTVSDGCQGVRKVLSEWAEGFEDRDGKFVKEFQSSYNSGFWELYLFAVLKHLGVRVDFSHAAPDFVCPDHALNIEATTANHAFDDVPEWEKTVTGVTHDDLEAAYLQSMIRFANAIDSKVAKFRTSYAKLDHCRDKSFVIAITNYSTQDFYMLGDVAMQRLLYDVRGEKSIAKKNGTKLDVGVFANGQYPEISAILYSSTATFGKARALGDDRGDFIFHAVRIKDNLEPIRILAAKEDYQESLCDGLRLFLNPWADRPVDPELFWDEGIRCFWPDRDGSLVVSCHPDGDLCARSVQQLVHKS